MPPKITLHHLVQSRTMRVFWCLEELGLKYDVKVHQRGADGRADGSLVNVSRLGKAPVLEIDNETLPESGAIINTLLNRFSHSGVETPPGQSSVYWSHFVDGSLMQYIYAARASASATKQLLAAAKNEDEKNGIRKHHDAVTKWATDQAFPALQEAELYLGEKKTFTGRDDLIGAGDFMMTSFFGLQQMIADMDASPSDKKFSLSDATKAYVARMRARPGWKAANARREEEEKKQAK